MSEAGSVRSLSSLFGTMIHSWKPWELWHKHGFWGFQTYWQTAEEVKLWRLSGFHELLSCASGSLEVLWWFGLDQVAVGQAFGGTVVNKFVCCIFLKINNNPAAFGVFFLGVVKPNINSLILQRIRNSPLFSFGSSLLSLWTPKVMCSHWPWEQTAKGIWASTC